MQKCCFDAGITCKILKKRKCQNCNFYKTCEQAKSSKEKAIKRLRTLDKSTRLMIADKYSIKEIV